MEIREQGQCDPCSHKEKRFGPSPVLGFRCKGADGPETKPVLSKKSKGLNREKNRLPEAPST